MSINRVPKIEIPAINLPWPKFYRTGPRSCQRLGNTCLSDCFFATLTTQPDGKIIIIMIKQQECSRERVSACVSMRVRACLCVWGCVGGDVFGCMCVRAAMCTTREKERERESSRNPLPVVLGFALRCVISF